MTQHKPPKIMHKKHIARAEREAILRRWVIGVSVGIVVLIVAIIAFGVIDQNVIQPAQPVAKVGSVEISTDRFQKSVKYQRFNLIQNYFQAAQIAQFFGDDPTYQNQVEQILAQLESPQLLGRQVLNNLIDDEVMRQEAIKRNIVIPPSEIDKNLQEAFGFYANGTPTPGPTATTIPTSAPTTTPTLAPGVTPTLVPTVAPTATLEPTPTITPGPSPTPFPTATPYTLDGYNTTYNNFSTRLTRTTGLTNDDLRRLVETNLLRTKIMEAMTKDTSRDVLEAKSRHILVADEKVAKDLLERIKKGEDFAKIAAEFSTDLSNKDQGGDLGTQPDGFFVPEFNTVVFTAPIGLYPEPVKTTFGYHIIDVQSRTTRKMTDDEFDQKKQDIFSKWLAEQRTNKTLVTEFDKWKTSIPTTPTIDSINKEEATAQAQTATATALKK